MENDATPEEQAAYHKGRYDGLKESIKNGKERIKTTGQVVKESILNHLIGYSVTAVLIISSITGGYFYFIKPTVDKVEQKVEQVTTSIDNANKKVSDTIDNVTSAKIFHPSKWKVFSSNKNETTKEVVKIEEKIIPKTNVVKINVQKTEIVKQVDQNKTYLTQKVKDKWHSLFNKKSDIEEYQSK